MRPHVSEESIELLRDLIEQVKDHDYRPMAVITQDGTRHEPVDTERMIECATGGAAGIVQLIFDPDVWGSGETLMIEYSHDPCDIGELIHGSNGSALARRILRDPAIAHGVVELS